MRSGRLRTFGIGFALGLVILVLSASRCGRPPVTTSPPAPDDQPRPTEVNPSPPPPPPAPPPPPPPEPGSRPTGAPAVPPKAEYQFTVAPTIPGTRTHLRANEPARVSFWIGPNVQENLLSPDQRTVNPRITGATTPLPLMVSLVCGVCDGPPADEQAIIYYPARGRSSVATFAITPTLQAALDDQRGGELIFMVSADAVQYDRVAVRVFVDPPAGTADEPSRQTSAGLGRTTRAADLKIRVSADGGQMVRLTLTPLDPTLKSRLAAVVGNRTASAYTTNLNISAIDTFTSNGYFALKRLMERWNPFGAAAEPVPAGSDSFLSDYSTSKLESPDRAVLLNEFDAVGNDLYRELFYVQQTPLQKVIEAVESFRQPGRPLRITIETDLVYLPWALLRSPRSDDVRDFWGFKFELTVLPTSVWIPPTTSVLKITPDDTTPFAVYVDDADYQGVGWFARKGAERTSSLLKRTSATLLESSSQASTFLTANRHSIKLLMTYMHATSFIQLSQGAEGPMIRSEIEGGPRLFFSIHDALTATTLRRLPNDLRLGSEPMLSSQPLVVLNACETGVAPFSPLANAHYAETLPIVMLKLGARGVIATDAPVFKLSAAHFGEILTKALVKGVPAPQAVWMARQELLGHGNPVGLLYSFYGDPRTRLDVGR